MLDQHNEFSSSQLIEAVQVLEANEDWSLAGNIYFHLIYRQEALDNAQRFQLAKKWLNHAQSLEQQDCSIRTILRLAAPLKLHLEALKPLEAHVSKNGASADLLAAMSSLALQGGDLEKAEDLAALALEIFPQHKTALRIRLLTRPRTLSCSLP